MLHPWSMRREDGAAFVMSLVLLSILFVVGSGTLTTSRIETQIASNDTKGKQVLFAAEYAMTLGESPVQQAECESGVRTLWPARSSSFPAVCIVKTTAGVGQRLLG